MLVIFIYGKKKNKNQYLIKQEKLLKEYNNGFMFNKASNFLIRYYNDVANNTEKLANDSYLVYFCIKTRYYGKTKYIFHETK